MAQLLGKVLALAATLLGAGMFVSRSLVPGSAKAAQAFMESAVDPLERVAKHFHKLVGRLTGGTGPTSRPVIVFVDDLDRCKSSYCVTLLEGIQTLFKDPRVMYVVAADRRF